jgi:hypothetical protein
MNVLLKRATLVALTVGILGLAVPSTCLAAKADGKKAKLIAKYDKNGNGIIDGDEKEALRKDFAKDPQGELKALDKNGDGKLDDDEIAAIKPGKGTGKKGEKKDEKKSEEKKEDKKDK